MVDAGTFRNNLLKDVGDLIDRKLSAFQPQHATPSPPAYPHYPHMPQRSLASEMKDFMEMMSMMKSMQATTDLDAEIARVEKINKLLGGRSQEDDAIGTEAVKGFFNLIMQKQQQKNNVPHAGVAPFAPAPTDYDDDEEIDMEESDMTDEQLQGLIDLVQPEVAKQILAGHIRADQIRGMVKLQYNYDLSDDEYARGMEILKKKYDNSRSPNDGEGNAGSSTTPDGVTESTPDTPPEEPNEVTKE